MSGVCATVLAAGQSANGVIAVDANYLYWTSTHDGTVMKVPVDGGDPAVLAAGQSSASRIAIDVASVYWFSALQSFPGEGDNLWRVFIGGGTSVLCAPGEISPGGLAVDATNIYWTNGTGEVRFMPVGGGQAATLFQETTNEQLGPIVSNGIDVYWASPQEGSIFMLPVNGPMGLQPTLIASGQNGIARLALDATSVYWTATSDGTIMKAPLYGGRPVTLALLQSHPTGIAVDATNVYWTNYQGAGTCALGSVMKVPITGGTPVTLASDQLFPDGIAVDATSLYWTTGVSQDLTVFDGPIMKLELAVSLAP